ncbi:MAG: homocitrate synthase [Candidatus Altiarchaeales archaeon]|nr:homocitrate synthase [Candidatus Altiarchaeales archaeon]
MAKPIIYFVDVTNRDGVQTARLGLAKLQKTILNLMLDKMGVFQSEFGFPNTRHELNYLNANLELREVGAMDNIRLSGWMRAQKADVEQAFKNVPKLKHVNVSISTSDQMIQGKFKGKMDRNGVLKSMVEAVQTAKSLGAESIGVNAEDASRTTDDQLAEFALTAKDAGGDRIRYCDTLGYDDPMTIYKRIRKLAEAVRMPIELHCHNDLGMAVACSVAGAQGAVDAGFDAYINTSVNGMGERAGNADLVSCILAVRKSSGLTGNYAIDPKIDLTQSWKISKYASYAFQVPIPINQPAVGSNAFAHESGIHADGALKDARNYELYHYEELGRGEPEIIETGRQIVAGEYSGIKGFRNVAGKLEIEFKDEDEAKKVLDLARYANVHTQLPLVDDEIRFIAKYPEQARKIMTVTP